ncbi:MAG: phospholipase D-like domain-containing protein, partial [Nannocystaceae bacterium]
HYRGAFAAATKTIYIENQHPGQLVLLRLLATALKRGVRVVMVVPGIPMRAIYQAAAEVSALAVSDRVDEHRYGPTFRALAELATFPNFTLVALARSDPDGAGGWRHREIYTHAKLAIVDGAWVTVGSANLVDLSLDYDHSELNASAWGEATALPLLRTLVGEHSDRDCDTCTDNQALEHLVSLARESRQSLLAGGPVVGGCYALDAARYALGPPLTAREPDGKSP